MSTRKPPVRPTSAGTGSGTPPPAVAMPAAGLQRPNSPTLDPLDMLQVLDELHQAQAAVIVLKRLLHRGSMDDGDNTTGSGLGLLLEGVRTHLDMAAERLMLAASLAGFQSVYRTYSVRA